MKKFQFQKQIKEIAVVLQEKDEEYIEKAKSNFCGLFPSIAEGAGIEVKIR